MTLSELTERFRRMFAMHLYNAEAAGLWREAFHRVLPQIAQRRGMSEGEVLGAYLEAERRAWGVVLDPQEREPEPDVVVVAP